MMSKKVRKLFPVVVSKIASGLQAILSGLQAILSGLQAILSGLQAILSGLQAIFTSIFRKIIKWCRALYKGNSIKVKVV